MGKRVAFLTQNHNFAFLLRKHNIVFLVKILHFIRKQNLTLFWRENIFSVFNNEMRFYIIPKIRFCVYEEKNEILYFKLSKILVSLRKPILAQNTIKKTLFKPGY